MMTENVQASSGEQQHVTAPAQPEPNPAPSVSEKMVPQSHVDRIAHERHKAGYEKGRSEGSQQGAWDEAKLTAWYQEQRKIEKEQERQTQNQFLMEQAQRAVEQASAELLPKLKEQGTKYEDFSKVTADLDLKHPGLVHALRSVENPADLAYELAKDPVLEDTVMRKLSSDSRADFDKGMKMLNTLSETLKNNETAKSKVTRSPLSTIKPSSTHADNGNKSIADLRRKYLM